jgi:hypothetical protein
MNSKVKKLKILFVGDMWYGSNARSLRDGFEQLGHDVLSVDTTPLTKPIRLSPAWVYKVINDGERLPTELRKIQESIAASVSQNRPDLLIVFKGIYINQAFLLSLPVKIKIHYSADDVSNPENLTADYLTHESEWDAVVTTKSFNVPELNSRGVRKPVFVWSAFDPALHFRYEVSPKRKFEIGFVGNRRPDRNSLILEVATQFQSKFYLAGPGWWRDTPALVKQANTFPRFGKYGHSFSKSISQIEVNIVLLNSENRDMHTCRSFEVPSAGGLVLAQKTLEHEHLFRDMISAALFESTEELMDKARYLIRHPQEADRIRELGYRSIINGGHTYRDRASQIVRELEC